MSQISGTTAWGIEVKVYKISNSYLFPIGSYDSKCARTSILPSTRWLFPPVFPFCAWIFIPIETIHDISSFTSVMYLDSLFRCMLPIILVVCNNPVDSLGHFYKFCSRYCMSDKLVQNLTHSRSIPMHLQGYYIP